MRAVVLHGDGPSFCSGLDVASIMAAGAGPDGPAAPLREEPPNWFQRAAYDWVRVPVPVIAALHGNCLGGGLQIALGADIRIAAPDTRLSVMEVKWGLIPDMSITQTLPRLVAIDVAKELTYTGRVFTGEEALRARRRDARGRRSTRPPPEPRGRDRRRARPTRSAAPSGCSSEAWTGSPARDAGARGRDPAWD